MCFSLPAPCRQKIIVAFHLARLHERPCKRPTRLAYDRSLALDIDSRYALLFSAMTGPLP